jgi:hypothetical protein
LSTRCNIIFSGRHGQPAAVFQYLNGMPEAMLPDLARFFADLQAVNATARARPGDTRFAHPEYLAARYITWQAGQWAAEDAADPLSVIGLGVGAQDIDLIAWTYQVTCNEPDAWPQVSYRQGRTGRHRSAAKVMAGYAADPPRGRVPPVWVHMTLIDQITDPDDRDPLFINLYRSCGAAEAAVQEAFGEDVELEWRRFPELEVADHLGCDPVPVWRLHLVTGGADEVKPDLLTTRPLHL